ncbi:MAG: hypothetical protein ACJ746_28500 [Bryobacteraceae bacterium]
MPGMVWNIPCLGKGMNIWVVLIAIQILISVVAFFRESGEDAQFEGDKLALRS